MKTKIKSLVKGRFLWHFAAVFTILTAIFFGVFIEDKDNVSADSPTVTRQFPATVCRGQTFDVTITFITTEKDFTMAALTDNAPEGWTVQVNQSWCIPEADDVTAVGNVAEFNWRGNPSFDDGTHFTAVYKVTVPQEATDGSYLFDQAGNAGVLFFEGNSSPFSAGLTGPISIQVTTGYCISGKIYEVNGQPFLNEMSGITINLSKNGMNLDTTTSDAQSNYSVHITEADTYWITVSKAGFRDMSRSIDITTLDHDYTLNFKGNTGLIPNAPDIWYSLDCAALWKYQPLEDPELGLTIWRLLDVAAAWKNPV